MLKKILTGILSVTLLMNQSVLLHAEEDEDDSDIATYEEVVDDEADASQTEWGEDAVVERPTDDEDESYSYDTDDPMMSRDVETFYQDEDGNMSEEAGIMTLSTNSLKETSSNLIHQSKVSNATKRIGIDVSEYQGEIDWNTVKNEGVEFAIIRVGYRGYVYSRLVEDKKVRQNIQNAKAAGVKIGLYFYSKAITTDEAKEEADFVKSVIGDTTLDLPIFLDVEYDGDADRLLNANLSSDAQTNIINTFISTCNGYGYSASVYASASVLAKKMNASSISSNGYIWVAHWTNNTNYSGTYNFWQYADNITLSGVSGNNGVVDADVWYDDGTIFNNIQHSVAMYRIYNPYSGEHFYTSSISERDNLVSLGWSYEGVGWNAPSSSNTPVYRLYNGNAGEHHYTMSASERDNLVRLGWKYEGIGWYSDDSRRVAVYRQYNPYAFANNHNYTPSLDEHNWLIGLGWRNEGIGWYGV